MAVTAKDLVRNGVKEKLARGELVVSMTVRLVRTIEIAEIARSAGFDTFYIDLEHSSFSLETTGQICMAGLALGITPLVRIADTSPQSIGRVLDGGALGVIAPHVQSASDAKAIVDAAKFPPLGNRGFTGSLPHLRFKAFPTKEVFAAMNDATMVVVMIESAEALAQVDEIAAVEGVDMLFIGSNDLASSMGIPGELDHKMIRDAYAQSIAACRKHGKHLGIGGLVAYPKLAAEMVELGCRYLSTGTDLSFLLNGATAKAKQARGD